MLLLSPLFPLCTGPSKLANCTFGDSARQNYLASEWMCAVECLSNKREVWTRTKKQKKTTRFWASCLQIAAGHLLNKSVDICVQLCLQIHGNFLQHLNKFVYKSVVFCLHFTCILFKLWHTFAYILSLICLQFVTNLLTICY